MSTSKKRNPKKRHADVKKKKPDKAKEKEEEIVIKPEDLPRPVLGIPLERTLAHADKVLYNLFAIVSQGVPLIRMNYGRTDYTRNKMALQLLASDFTHLIMLDIDHVHPVNIISTLMSHFIAYPDLLIVGGLNYRRGAPYDPCAFIKSDSGEYHPIADWEQGLIRVDALGTGCIAIAREVFEQIEPPWFYNDYSKIMDDVWPGEDMGFARLCEEHGIKQFVDTNLTSPHLIDSLVDGDTFKLYMEDNNMGVAPVGDFVKGYKSDDDKNP